MKINDIIQETTSAGGIATVAAPLGGMQKRPNASVFANTTPKKKKKKKTSEAEVYSKTTLSDKEIAAAEKRVADRVAKRKEVEKNRQKNIKSGHNKKVQQFVHSEGEKIMKQWEEQLLTKFPKMEEHRGPREADYIVTPISLVKDAMKDGIETTARLVGRRAINRNGIGDEKLRSYYDQVIKPGSEEILLSLLPQIDFDKINAAYDDPSILEMEEGKSPHKKGTKKYKKHMAAMHAEATLQTGGYGKPKKSRHQQNI